MSVLPNAKHERFAQGLLQGMTADAAYEAAGFKPNRGNATRLKANESIMKRVEELLAEREARLHKKFEVTKERVLTELSLLGFSNMMDYVSVQDGSAYVDLSKLSREQAAAISEITSEVYMDGKGDDAERVKRTKFKLYDKRAALVDMGKHLGMFRDRVEHTGKDGGPIETAVVELSEAERARRVAFILQRGLAPEANQ